MPIQERGGHDDAKHTTRVLIRASLAHHHHGKARAHRGRALHQPLPQTQLGDTISERTSYLHTADVDIVQSVKPGSLYALPGNASGI